MITLLVIWFMLLVALLALAIGRRRDGGALPLTYFLGLSLIHVPGALVYVLPGADLYGEEVTMTGFQITLVGLAAFVTGTIWSRVSRKQSMRIRSAPVPVESLNGFGWLVFIIGSLSFFVLLPLAALVPSLNAIVAPLGTMIVVGMWLRLYVANAVGDRGKVRTTLAMTPLLPLATVLTGGFISYGTNWVLSVVAFLYVISGRRISFYLGAPVVVVLGLSLFAAYMGERGGIRDVVWQQNASYGDRLERIGAIFTNFRLLDITDPMHRAALDGRLNQNILVGIGAIQYRKGLVELAYGSTLQLWALIPRAVWPDKPAISGGSSVVTAFTGIYFDEATTVGAGQVLEFYVNFGLPGVIVGFLALGFILMRLDCRMMQAFANGDKRGILLRAMPGLTLLQPGGNALEIMVATIGAVVAAHLVLFFLPRAEAYRSRRKGIGARSGPPRAPAGQNAKSQQPLR